MHCRSPTVATQHAGSAKAKLSAATEKGDAGLLLVRVVIATCLFAVLTLRPGVAFAQNATAVQDQNANTGNDLFRPPANLFQMMYQSRTAPGSGSTSGSTVDVTTETLNLRMDHS